MTPQHFQGFFSYSHHDDKTDPAVIKAFTTTLENRVTARLTNAIFSIWRDKHGLRTGDRWPSELEAVIRESHIFMVIMSPKWIESPICCKEYSVFQEREKGCRETMSHLF
jgi:hypothetical protein